MFAIETVGQATGSTQPSAHAVHKLFHFYLFNFTRRVWFISMVWLRHSLVTAMFVNTALGVKRRRQDFNQEFASVKRIHW